MILVKRDQRSTTEIAEAMGVDKSYLPKLYKMDKLPSKPRRRAAAVFHVPESYFTENEEDPDIAAEPEAEYRAAAPGQNETARLREELAALREELARLTKMLEQEKSINANLAEALANLSKRS